MTHIVLGKARGAEGGEGRGLRGGRGERPQTFGPPLRQGHGSAELRQEQRERKRGHLRELDRAALWCGAFIIFGGLQYDGEENDAAVSDTPNPTALVPED